MHGLLDAVAEKAPALLVIEDTHWADRSTRDMLSFLFSRPFVGPVAVVASYRSDDLHRRHPLRKQVAEWTRIRGVERLQLPPLAAPDVRSLIQELHPDPMDENDVADIVDRAEGNAFFVEELVGAASGPGRWVPSELADVLLVRLDRLDDQARQVVRAASVAGRRVSHDMLSEASALDPGCLDEGLRQAVEMNILLAHGQRYVFRHALLGEAVYDDLLPGERVRLHKAYAEALSQGRARGTAAELARHARLAMDLDTALNASIRAGDEAIAVGGPDEAAHHYQQALELLADPARAAKCEVEVSKLAVNAAEALTASGHPIRAAALLKEQLDLLPADADPSRRARLLSARANCLVLIETDEDRIAVSEEAVALVPDLETGLRAKILVTHARVLASMARFEEAQVVGVDALGLAEKLDLNELASDAITTLSQLKKAGPKEGLRAALVEAVARAEKSGALNAELRGRWLLGPLLPGLGGVRRDREVVHQRHRARRGGGHPLGAVRLRVAVAARLVALTRGQWDRVLELTEVPGQAPPIPRALLDSVRVAVLVGRGEDVAAEVQDLRRYWHKEGGVAISSAGLEMVLAGRRNDPAAVLAVYESVVAEMSTIWHPWFTARIRLAAVTIGAIAATVSSIPASERAGYVEVAERLYRDGHTVLERYADPSGFWGPEGRAWVKLLEAELLRMRWLCGVDAPPADVLVDIWREAVVMFEDYGDVHGIARAQAVLAGILRATGDAAGAREVGDRARATARQLGAQPLLDELRSLGSGPSRSDTSSATLTPREREILALVAEGRSNGEIGKLLFISAKTVSVHVSNILGKLDASGRTEAAAIARRRGLLD